MIDCYELTYKTYCRDDYDCYKIAEIVMIMTRLAYMIMSTTNMRNTNVERL